MHSRSSDTDSVARRLAELGLTLPPFPAARAHYVPFRTVGRVVYISGQGPALAESAPSYGKIGTDLTLEQGTDAARRAALNLVAVVKEACSGNLSKVRQCVKIVGYVNSASGFVQQPAVIDGATDLLLMVFGEAGLPARVAVAAPELPFNVAVELDAIFELI
jgi:enamine deaminase RidA (YjgF/YER057c/UK114 family)